MQEPFSQAPFFRGPEHGLPLMCHAFIFFFSVYRALYIYWLYADACFIHRTSGLDALRFWRFSRLYPLHINNVIVCWSRWFSCFGSYSGSISFISIAMPIISGLENLAFSNTGVYRLGIRGTARAGRFLSRSHFTYCSLSRAVFAPCALQAIVSMVIALGLAHFSIIASAAVAFFSGGATYYGFTITQRHRSISVAILAIVGTIFIWAIFAPLTNAKTVAGLTDFIRHAVPSDWGNNCRTRPTNIYRTD